MLYCLNPKKPHENQHVPPPSTGQEDSSAPAPFAQQSSSADEEQVACRYCKYLLEGAVLGDCRLIRWIGSGSFGDVYEAEQLPPLKRRVAIKVMAAERILDEQAADLFAREVGTIASLDHPNILPVLRVGALSDGRSYLVMKYAAHGSLQQFCQGNSPGLSILPTALVQSIANKQEDQEAPSEQADQETLDSAMTRSLTLTTEDEQPSEAEEPDEPQAPPTAEGEQPSETEMLDETPTLPVSSPQEAVDECETVVIEGPPEENAAPARANELETTPASSPTLLTPQQLLPYVEDACSALQYAHERGLIHLDVKPANLLLDAQDRLLLADFGVAVLLDGYTHASLHCYVGTPLYTAPEQWLEQPRAASDQYGLAITCYHLLTGRAPFMGNLYAVMHGHLQVSPPPLQEFNPLIPAQVEAVILRALAKDPTERYKDMLSFACAYREAVEAAASATTDVHSPHMQERISALLERVSPENPSLPLPVPEQAEVAVALLQPAVVEDVAVASTALSQSTPPAVLDISIGPPAKSEWESPAAKLRPPKRSWQRTLLLVLLTFLLLGSSSLAVVRVSSPCTLGICPRMALDAHDVSFTNDSSQTVKVSNTGSADLNWQASLSRFVPWLTLSPSSGSISPRKATSFTIAAHTANLANGEYTDQVQVSGQDVATQDVTVTVQVQKGLAAISTKITGTQFLYEQNQLQPATQKITITNKSGHAFAWSTQYTQNTWLSVLPSQGVLNDGKSVDLAVTVVNPQNLTPNTYQVTVSLIGKLDNQAEQALLQEKDFTLRVSPSTSVTPTVSPVQATPTPQSAPYSFGAQAAVSSNAPAALRSAHSMVWDSQDNLLLVFGGVDVQGNLLNDLWSYNPTSGAWTNLSPQTPGATACNGGSVPPPRMNAALVWDNLHSQLLLYGGLGAGNHYLGDLWSYSVARGWNAVICAGNGPGPRATSAIWNGSQMLILGGLNQNGLLADFWAYTPTNNSQFAWQRLTASTPLGPRAYATLVWDSTDKQLYVFGGLNANGQQSDFYSYSPANGWATITPTSTTNPPARQQGMGAWDSKDNVMLLMGGWLDSSGIPYYGLWAFDPRQDAWWLVTPLQNNGTKFVPGRNASVMVWDAVDQRAYIYAGAGSTKNASSLNDLWMVFPD